jgi:hypothetical protein
MRFALVLVALLVAAPVAHAQQNLAPANVAPAPETQRIPERAAAPEWTRPAVAELERAEFQQDADAPAALAQPTRTSWWWLVGAIVVAGVILAVIL